jgi:hypothetical protein
LPEGGGPSLSRGIPARGGCSTGSRLVEAARRRDPKRDGGRTRRLGRWFSDTAGRG